jgi:acyl-homoserine lactone synthase
MIYAITPENRALYPSFVEQQFQIRHAIFVKEKGWKEFGRRSTYEMDQYDDEEAIYILAAEGDRVIAGFRLYPTTRPHMLLNAFPSLSKAKSRRLLTFWERSHFYRAGQARQRRVLRARRSHA